MSQFRLLPVTLTRSLFFQNNSTRFLIMEISESEPVRKAEAFFLRLVDSGRGDHRYRPGLRLSGRNRGLRPHSKTYRAGNRLQFPSSHVPCVNGFLENILRVIQRPATLFHQAGNAGEGLFIKFFKNSFLLSGRYRGGTFHGIGFYSKVP